MRPDLEVAEGITGTAARAIYQLPQGMLPKIRFVVETRELGVIAFELTLEEAAKFMQQGITAIQAATPRLPRPAANSVYDN